MNGFFDKKVRHTNSDNNVWFSSGDEILAVNGSILHGLSHDEAIAIFKRIRSGPVVLQVGRRTAATAATAAAVPPMGGMHHYSTMGRPARKPPVPPPKLVSKNNEGYLQ